MARRIPALFICDGISWQLSLKDVSSQKSFFEDPRSPAWAWFYPTPPLFACRAAILDLQPVKLTGHGYFRASSVSIVAHLGVLKRAWLKSGKASKTHSCWMRRSSKRARHPTQVHSCRTFSVVSTHPFWKLSCIKGKLKGLILYLFS